MSDLSPKARYRLIGVFCVVILIVGVMYALRVNRLAAAVGRSGTFNRVKGVLVKDLGMDSQKVQPGSSLSRDLDFDELDQVEFVMALEEEFDIEISDEEAAKLLTIDDAVRLVDRKLKDRLQKTSGLKGEVRMALTGEHCA